MMALVELLAVSQELSIIFKETGLITEVLLELFFMCIFY